jgi:hypothetical protein
MYQYVPVSNDIYQVYQIHELHTFFSFMTPGYNAMSMGSSCMHLGTAKNYPKELKT